MPKITIDGQELTPRLHAGSYSGDFTGIYGKKNPNGSSNISQLKSWKDYKTLLEDGKYQSNAFSPYPALWQQVTVYTFSDFQAPLDEFTAATQAISFTINPEKTTILHYGFEGADIGDNGFRRYSYSVPDGQSKLPSTKMLIVLGDDITNYSLQGYKNGDCDADNKLDDVHVTVNRSQENFSDVLHALVSDFFTQYGGIITVPEEMFLGSIADLLYESGPLSETTRERYQYGMLEDIISEVQNLKRVFYLEFPVTIPKGESVSIAAAMHKMPSFDFGCSDSDNVGIQGYDMVTQLGSTLHFDKLTADIINTEFIEILHDNFGFDLAKDITKVTLDPNTEHYYLKVRAINRSK